MKKDTVVCEDFTMDYAVFGNGPENLVIIPGVSTNKVTDAVEMVAEMYKPYQEYFTCWLFDRKNNMEDGYTMEEMAEDTVQAIKALGIEKASLLGTSQGGMISMVIAARYPELVDKLCLNCTCAKSNDVIRAAAGRWIEQAENGRTDELTVDMTKALFTDAEIARFDLINASLANLPDQESLNRFVIMSRPLLDFDFTNVLDDIQADALLMGPAEDKVLSAESSRDTAELIGCPVYQFKGCGHAAYDTCPELKAKMFEFFTKQFLH